MSQLITSIPPSTVGGVPVATWQRTKIADAIARYHVRRITGVMSERAAAFMLEARLVAITAQAEWAEGRLS